MGETLLSFVLNQSYRLESKAALIDGQRVITYAELRKRIFGAAQFLRDLGIESGDRVVLSASNSPSFVFGYLAVHALGATAIPIDPQSGATTIEYIIDRVQPRAIFFGECKNSKYETMLINVLGTVESDHTPLCELRTDSTADILFTTGTTGKPKGVALSHRSILSAARNINAFIGNRPQDLEIVPLPLCHSFGLGRLRCNLLTGATLIFSEGVSFPGKFFQALDHWKATGLSMVPAGIAVLFELTGDKLAEYADQLRYIEIGSSPMAMAHKQRLLKVLPRTRVCMHYGLTEASRSSFICFQESPDKLDSVGRPSPNVEIQITDETGKPLPNGRTGQILIRGQMVMSEYLLNPEETQKTFVRGYLRSGDLGHFDSDGYLYLESREKDLINVGGRKVSPLEIEEYLRRHETILDCACTGLPDPKGISGELVKAYIVGKPNVQPVPPSVLIEFLRQFLESYKIPAQFEWISSIPRTSSGKIQRFRLGIQ